MAVIKELKGTVKVKKAGGSKEFTAFAKMSLNQGDILSTGAGATAVLQFANGTAEDDKMTVAANTKLTFSKLSDRNGTTTKVSMWSGSAWADVKSITSKDDEFKLETPTAVMGVRGTHLLVSVDPATGDTRLIVAAGVVRTETTGSGERQEKDVYPTQRALITDANEEQPADIFVAPVDLSLLMSQSDENIVSAILGSAAEIMDENQRYSDQYAQEGLPEPLGETPEDLNRFKSNTENLLGAIADQAVKSGLLTQERLDRIVSEVKEQSGLTIDLSKKQLDTTEADKKKQEEQRKLEAEQKKKAEEQRKKELERRSAEEALLKQLEEAKKKQAEANKQAEEEKKKKALETYESGLSDAQKAKYEQEKKNRAAEQAAQSPSPSPSSTPPPASQPVPSNIATLSDLKIFGSTLMGFNANTTSYSLNVSSETAEVSVSPFVTSGSNATVKVGGVAVTSGSATSVILAPAGSSTVIEIVVTAENGVDKKTYRVTVNRTAAVNMPPTDIVLSNPNVDEGTPQGTVVSEITAVDSDSEPPFEFDLVSGDGADDNEKFFIVLDTVNHVYQLAVNDVLDYESKSTLSIRVRVIDNLGASFEKALVVHVANVDESPNADDVTGLSVNEDEMLTGTLSGSDPDGDDLTFMLDMNASKGNVTVAANGNFSYMPNANYFGSDEFRYKVYDGTTYSGTAVVYINVIPVNDAPTDITLSNVTIAENSEADSIIGSLSATGSDSGDTFTYALVSGEGSDDNASFSISGTNLLTGAPLNYESKNLYSIRVRVTDGGGLTYEKTFEIHISDVNEPPTADTPTGQSVNEDEILTGTLTGSDPEGEDLDFILVSPAAHALSITLDANGDFSYTPYDNYSGADEFTFKVSDGNSFSEIVTVTINVLPVNDEPTNITLSNATIAENSAIGYTIGSLAATDPDTDDTFTYTLVSGTGDTDNASFSISGTNLLTGAPLNYESKNLYHIRVRVTDGGGLNYEKAFEIHVSDVNEPPTADTPTGLSINEDEILTGTLTGSDPEGDDLDFILVTPAVHAMQVTVDANGDFTYRPYGNYAGTDEFTFKVSDGNSFSAVVTVNIDVIPVNDEPTNITLSNATIAENSGIGFIVGALGATDPDSGDTFMYTLVSGDGDSDNASFSISGANLLTAVPVNYESKNLYHIRVRVTDSEGLTYEKALEIHITDVDESLTNIAISDLAFFDYTTRSEAIGTLVPTGGEGGITYSLVAGTGDGDNTQFAINGNLLLTSASYDDGFKVTYNIRVRATDSNGSQFEKNLTLVTTKYFTYTDIVDYASGARTYSSVVSGVPKVSGHEFFASLSSAAIGIQIAMRADLNQPSEFYWNGSETPINVGRYYVTPVAGWNEALLKVTDPDNIIREYKFHIWAGDTLPANLALASITANDSASQALSPSVDGANPLLWRAYVADPSATYVDFSPQFAAGTQITRVILANGQYAEASGSLANGYRIPYTGTPTYAYIYAVGSDGKPFVYKLSVEPMTS